MSKVGLKPIPVAQGTQIVIADGIVNIKGKEGAMELAFPRVLNIAQEGDAIILATRDQSKRTRSLHGLFRTLIQNAVIGVNEKWQKKLTIFGTGYRVKAQGEDLIFEVGYSHPVHFKKVKGVTFVVEGNNTVIVSGVDKQVVGSVAFKIRSIKKPDPYKGKGVRYEGEVLKLKPGKKAKAAV